MTAEPHGPDELVAPPATQLRKATLAVYAIFIVNGFAFASWASRIPQFRDDLGVNPAQLGLILLSAALGSLVALPLSGIVVTRLGEVRAIVLMSMLLATGLVIAGIGATHGMFPVIAGLALIGFGNAHSGARAHFDRRRGGIHGAQVTAERVQIHVEVWQQINLVDEDEVS